MIIINAFSCSGFPSFFSASKRVILRIESAPFTADSLMFSSCRVERRKQW